MIILKHTNVDGNSIWDKWKKTPTKKELVSLFKEYYEEDVAIKTAEELLKRGIVDVDESDCSQFELVSI